MYACMCQLALLLFFFLPVSTYKYTHTDKGAFLSLVFPAFRIFLRMLFGRAKSSVGI